MSRRPFTYVQDLLSSWRDRVSLATGEIIPRWSDRPRSGLCKTQCLDSGLHPPQSLTVAKRLGISTARLALGSVSSGKHLKDEAPHMEC